MSIKQFFTSYFDSLSDKKTRFHYDKELRTKLIEDRYFNFYKGKKKFAGVILQVNYDRPSAGTQTSPDDFLIAKIRPIDIHDFIIPNPCESGLIQGAVEERIDLHPTAYSDFKASDQLMQVGQVVECYYEVQGPQSHGKQRGLRFRKNMIYGDAVDRRFTCLERYSDAFKNSSREAWAKSKSTRTPVPRGLGDVVHPPSNSEVWRYTSSQVETMTKSNTLPPDWDIKNFPLKTFVSKGDGSLLVDKFAARALDNLYNIWETEQTPHPNLEQYQDQDYIGSLKPLFPKIVSTYRDHDHNEDVGGAKGSQHTHGKAFDLVVSGWSKMDRLDLIYRAYDLGFRGFGVGNTRLHIDTRKTKSYWGYKSGGWCSSPGKNGCGKFEDGATGNWVYIQKNEMPWAK